MMKAVVEKALSLVGQGYIYGAKGQTCSPAFRQQQAEQYPEQADNILGTGAKWDGKNVWDCAQLTRAAAKAGGVTLVSGATSQWNKTDWDETGTIDSMPQDEVLFLYRRQNGSTTTMQHTGVALGDGMAVHARGTAYGVVWQAVGEYPWTHWARPKWPQETPENGENEGGASVLYKAKVTAEIGSTVNLRTEPAGNLLDRVNVGETVEVLLEKDGWSKVIHNGEEGWMMTAFLSKENGGETVTITLPAEAARALKEALEKAVL